VCRDLELGRCASRVYGCVSRVYGKRACAET